MDKRPSLQGFGNLFLRNWGLAMSGPPQFWVTFLVAVIVLAFGGFFTWIHSFEGVGLTMLIAFSVSLNTFYKLWADERNKICDIQEMLEPKLNIEFDPDMPGCRESSLGNNSIQIMHVRVLPKVSVRVKGCIGFLHDLWFFENEKWVHTDLHESVKLIWANSGAVPGEEYYSRTLVPGQKQFLQVICLDSHDGKATIVSAEVPPLKQNILDFHGKYKLDIEIQGEGHVRDSISLEFESGGDWHSPKVKKISKTQ